MAISTTISLGAVWLGLCTSAMFNLPPSFPIVTIACVVWSVVWVSNRRRVAVWQMSVEASPAVTSSTRQAAATSGI
jgi:zinc/manganese transport system permease protein